MAIATVSAPRRRNVTPKSSVLHRHIKDVDCSGMTNIPEDGEIVIVTGTTGSYGTAAGNGFIHATTPTVTDLQGSNLRMVWGSALRSDRSASGQQRVATFHGGHVEVECKLFNHENGSLLGATGNYKPGSLVSVTKAGSAVAGSADRIVCHSVPEGELCWAIGVVISVSQNTAVASNGDSIRIRLYDSPQKTGKF